MVAMIGDGGKRWCQHRKRQLIVNGGTIDFHTASNSGMKVTITVAVSLKRIGYSVTITVTGGSGHNRSLDGDSAAEERFLLVAAAFEGCKISDRSSAENRNITGGGTV